jgi:LPXTG-motif cell wall-anchored protein
LRLLTSTLLTALLAGFALLGGAGQASAAGDNYQYWGYFQVQKGAFAYASKGAGVQIPADGTVEGHRWAASKSEMITPRADLAKLTFDAICGNDKATADQKRIAVIVDFGPAADAIGADKTPTPFADCAVVPTKATGLQALQAVADVRTKVTSMGVAICAIDSYPSTTCANGTTTTASAPGGVTDIAIKGTVADNTKKADDSKTPLLIGAGVLVALLALGGVLLGRRNKA